MNNFDKQIKDMIHKEKISVPDSVHESIEKTLASLPAHYKKSKTRIFTRIAVAAACFIFVTLFLLPNISTVYAREAAKIPIIGKLVEVLTIRNYFYSDDNHEMDINVPNVSDKNNSSAAERINMNVDELTHDLVTKFYNELQNVGDKGYSSTYLNNDTITNSNDWFTLKLTVTQTYASSDVYYKFYHIDRRDGQYIELKDLFISDAYRKAITKDIKKQMKKQMKKDKKKVYFAFDSLTKYEFSSIDENQNFYLNSNNELVIVFDKYEVAPGAMGCPEFVIKKSVISNLLKPKFLDIIK